MSEMFELEVRASRLDVARAINAYIPLLEQTYRLARAEPLEIPAGYQEVSLVEANVTALAEMATGDAAAADVGVEAEAMLRETTNPERFGVIVREVATDSLLVVIRGTLVIDEWLKNFTAIPNPYDFAPDFGLVHLGFEGIYRSVRNSIFNTLREQPQTRRITLVGHSLGGAIATLAAPDIMVNLEKQLVDVFTVGGPRVGKSDFRGNFNQIIHDCFRVTNQLDIVPHLPTVATLWRHVGEEIEVDGDLDNAHSLDAYLAGLQKLLEPPAGPAAAALGSDAPMAVVVP
ncbi:MAG: lipase family protein [Vicinamibacteraceae bacterium]